jgi:hypothetical protein
MKNVEVYLEKGFDCRTAEYFTDGRKRIVAVKANDNFTLHLALEVRSK